MSRWQEKVLWINLTEGTIKEELLDVQVAKAYIGGRGLGTYYRIQPVMLDRFWLSIGLKQLPGVSIL